MPCMTRFFGTSSRAQRRPRVNNQSVFRSEGVTPHLRPIAIQGFALAGSVVGALSPHVGGTPNPSPVSQRIRSANGPSLFSFQPYVCPAGGADAHIVLASSGSAGGNPCKPCTFSMKVRVVACGCSATDPPSSLPEICFPNISNCVTTCDAVFDLSRDLECNSLATVTSQVTAAGATAPRSYFTWVLSCLDCVAVP